MAQAMIMRRGGGNPLAIPDGNTITPTDVEQIWIECAGIKYSSVGSPTLAQIVVNADLCATLMSSANAVHYMIRSLAIQAAVTGSATAIAALDASNPIVNPYMTANSEDGYTISASGYDGGAPYMICDSNQTGTYITNWADSIGDGNTMTAILTLPYPIWIYKIVMYGWEQANYISCSADGVTYTSVGTTAAQTTTPLYLNGTTLYKYVRVQKSNWAKFMCDLRVYGKV